MYIYIYIYIYTYTYVYWKPVTCGEQYGHFSIPRSHKPRSFESKLRKRCTKKLDGALRRSTPYL